MRILSGSVTHFEIYAEHPATLAEFYRQLFDWRLDKAPGVDYWRIETGAAPARGVARDAGTGTRVRHSQGWSVTSRSAGASRLSGSHSSTEGGSR